MAFLKYRELAERMARGDAQALSDEEISRTISFARITLIVGLVFLHYQGYPDSSVSPFRGMDIAHHQVATFVNSFTLFFFFSVVPLLSTVSGWLFFSFDPHEAAASLHKRIRRRFSSLYLPLAFWNALFVVLLAGLFAWRPDYPLFGQLNIAFGHASVMDYVNAVFGITRHPVGFQFWFVRDLFVTAMVSPLLWLSLRYAPWLGMALLGAAWLSGSHLWIFFRTDVTFFFYMGGLLRLRQVPLHLGRRTAWIAMTLYLVLVALRTLAPWAEQFVHLSPHFLAVATRATRPLGVLACWGVFQRLAQTRGGAAIARYGGLAFFLHAIHFPLLAEVKILLWPLVPAETDGWLMAHYLASVTLTVAIGMGTGLLLAYKAPTWFALMNGGRPGTLPAGGTVASSARWRRRMDDAACGQPRQAGVDFVGEMGTPRVVGAIAAPDSLPADPTGMNLQP